MSKATARALEEFDAWLPAFRSRAAARTTSRSSPPTTAATPPRPSTDHSREYVPLLASGPSVRAGRRSRRARHALRYRPDGGREFRRATRERQPAFYRKSYEKTCHGGQLEDVQDARGNHCILREVPAAGREVRALRDRDLSPLHESRRGRRRRQGLAHPHRRAEHRWAKEGAFTGEISGPMIDGRGRHARHHRPQRAPPVFRRDRRDGAQAHAGGARIRPDADRLRRRTAGASARAATPKPCWSAQFQKRHRRPDASSSSPRS